MKIIERIHNLETNETVDLERDMTAQELTDYQAKKLKAEAKTAEEAEKEAARQAVLTKLGLTPEEAATLLS